MQELDNSVRNVSLEQLFSDEYDFIFRFLSARAPNREVAQDLTAETFLSALRGLERGESVQRPWLVFVAKRRLVDHWRRSAREEKLLEALETVRTVSVLRPDLSFDPELADAMRSIPARQRSALVLRYVLDRSIQEVADELGMTYKAAEGILGRGRQRLGVEYEASVHKAAV